MTPDTTCYVPGIGEMTAGQIAEAVRAANEEEDISPWEADLRRLEVIATEHLSPDPAWRGDTPPDASQ